MGLIRASRVSARFTAPFLCIAVPNHTSLQRNGGVLFVKAKSVKPFAAVSCVLGLFRAPRFLCRDVQGRLTTPGGSRGFLGPGRTRISQMSRKKRGSSGNRAFQPICLADLCPLRVPGFLAKTKSATATRAGPWYGLNTRMPDVQTQALESEAASRNADTGLLLALMPPKRDSVSRLRR